MENDTRFIPARAGNRKPPRVAPAVSSVHPRACGEQNPTHSECSTTGGSSPRVRGTVNAYVGTIGVNRFSPARAGNRILRGSIPA